VARVDVTELLVDPDFVDTISVITRVSTVNTRGENVMSESTLVSVGSVQPISGKAIQRLPDEFRLADVKTFWFKGEIVASSPGKYSSILVFKGKRYQVITVLDWLNFGEGWTEGMCVAEVPA